MKKKTVDWLLGKTLPEQDTMCVNIDAKIDNYRIAYGLTHDWVDSVKLICQTFHAAYTQVMESRATGKQRDTWFDNLRKGSPKGSPAPAAPIFVPITLPTGATIGLYEQLRDKVDFFKSNEAYTEADGDDLMITSPKGTTGFADDDFPEWKFSQDASGNITATYTRGDADGAELQWREVGQTMWQLADKSTETTITFKPNLSTPNAPTKIELRGVFIVKNQRVGQWSPNYNLTVG